MKKKPFNLLFFAGLTSFILAILFRSKSIDIHMHDYYLVVNFANVAITTGIALCMIWGIYRIFQDKVFMVTWTWIHVILSLVSAFAILTSVWWLGTYFNGSNNFSVESLNSQGKSTNQLIKYDLLMLSNQFILIIHIILGIKVKGKPNSN